MEYKHEVIAKYMGLIQRSYTPTSEKMWCDPNHGLPVGELKFDTWEWMMPVILKIRNEGAIVEISFSIGTICKIWTIKSGWFSYESNEPIDAVYSAVLDHIESRITQ